MLFKDIHTGVGIFVDTQDFFDCPAYQGQGCPDYPAICVSS